MWFPHQVLHQPIVLSAPVSRSNDDAMESASSDGRNACLQIPMRLLGTKSVLTVRDANRTTSKDFVSQLRFCLPSKIFAHGVTIRLVPLSVSETLDQYSHVPTFESILRCPASDVVKLPYRHCFRDVNSCESSSVGDGITLRSLLTLTEQLSLQKRLPPDPHNTTTGRQHQPSLCCVVISRLELEEEERRLAGVAREEADRRRWITECMTREESSAQWSVRFVLHPADRKLFDAVSRATLNVSLEAMDEYFLSFSASITESWKQGMDAYSREYAVQERIGPTLKRCIDAFFANRVKVSEFEQYFPKGGAVRGCDTLSTILANLRLKGSLLSCEHLHLSLPHSDLTLDHRTTLADLERIIVGSMIGETPVVQISFHRGLVHEIAETVEEAWGADHAFLDAADNFESVMASDAVAPTKPPPSALSDCMWTLSTTRDALTQVYIEVSRCMLNRGQVMLSSRLKTTIDWLLSEFLTRGDSFNSQGGFASPMASQELLSLQIDLTETMRSRFGFSIDLSGRERSAPASKQAGSGDIQVAILQRWGGIFQWLTATVSSKAQQLEEVACMALVVAMLEHFGLWSARRYPAVPEEERILKFCLTVAVRCRCVCR